MILGILFASVTSLIFAQNTALKAFVLADTQKGNFTEVSNTVKGKLKETGFTIVGEYTPYAGTTIIIVTNPLMNAGAAKSNFGAYGAIQRVSITEIKDKIQVSYTNPVYMSHAYRMKTDYTPVLSDLKKALGFQSEYGSEKGKAPAELAKYHYMMGMEYFSDPHLLHEYASYEEAIAAVEKGLSQKRSGISKIFRVDLKDKKESVFGVAMVGSGKDGHCQDDKFIMNEIDFKDIRSSAHLPYEMIVSGNKVYALSARFRIAINFPDLSMAGKNSFMNIMCAPGGIKEALEKVAGKK